MWPLLVFLGGFSLGVVQGVLAGVLPDPPMAGLARKLFLQGEYLYVADWFSGLHIYHLRDPAQPVHVGFVHTPGSPKGIWVTGGVAYVGDDDQGVAFIDVTDPVHPRWIGNFPTSGLAYGVKRVGTLLFVADHRGGLTILDVKDPFHPRRVSALPLEGLAWGVDVKDQVAYVAADEAGLVVVDIRDPEHPVILSTYGVPGAEDVWVQDGMAYVASYSRGLQIVDVSDPAHPRGVGALGTPAPCRGVLVRDGVAYLAAWKEGLLLVDVSNPTEPRLLTQIPTDGSVWDVKIRGHWAYLADWEGGVKVVDLSNPARARLVGRDRFPSTAYRIWVQGNYAYFAGGAQGLAIWDVTNRVVPVWLTSLGVEVEIRLLTPGPEGWLLAGGENRLYVMDVSDPFSPRVLARKQFSRRILDLVSRKREVFVLTESGLYGFTLSSQGKLVERGVFPEVGKKGIRRLQAWKEGILIGGGEEGLFLIQVSPARIQVLRKIQLVEGTAPQRILDLEKVGETLFVLFDRTRLHILRSTGSGGRFHLVSTLTLERPARDLFARSHRLYVAGGEVLWVYALEDLHHPLLLQKVEIGTGVVSVYVDHTGMIYLAAGRNGFKRVVLENGPE